MKHQYFGDVNDYRKYGLLRVLAKETGLSLRICWMLTADDGRHDGKFIEYLSKPDSWRMLDSNLFDFLAASVPKGRSLGHVRGSSVLGKALVYEPQLKDSRVARTQYFAGARKALIGAELVFFDPDNGIEVSSTRLGRKGSCKYLYWEEIESAYATGSSVLVYQHYPRVERRGFARRLAVEMARRLGVSEILEFSTAKVAFVLVPQPNHRAAFEIASRTLLRDWGSQFRVHLHSI